MKVNKNNVQIIILLVSAFGLMAIMLFILIENKLPIYNNSIALMLATILVILTAFIYALLIINRIKPKKHIYLSYTKEDKETAEKIISVLSDLFKKMSKYRFEFITGDSVPFGSNIYTTIKKNISEAEIAIIIVSPSYIRNTWCQEEFLTIYKDGSLIIPVVTEAFSDLTKLPQDISNIKALSLIDCKSEEDFSKAMSILAKDLIKRRND